MDTRKLLVATAAVFVVYSGLAFVIHEVILGPDYEPMVGSALRSVEAFTQRVPLLYLGNLVFALAFCLIYAKGYEPTKGWLGQGLRFGLILGTLLAPIALTEYVVYPVAGLLALKWILFGYVQVILSALVAAGLYRP